VRGGTEIESSVVVVEMKVMTKRWEIGGGRRMVEAVTDEVCLCVAHFLLLWSWHMCSKIQQEYNKEIYFSCIAVVLQLCKPATKHKFSGSLLRHVACCGKLIVRQTDNFSCFIAVLFFSIAHVCRVNPFTTRVYAVWKHTWT